MTDERDQATKRWIEDAEEALSRIGDALRAAWEETHEARLATLESAKEATSRLGDTIDQGIDAAKKRWEPQEGDTAPTGETGQPADEEE
jgi:hypothetical protein